jgi:hypothetical protein
MFIFVLFCYCYGHNGHNGQALIVSVPCCKKAVKKPELTQTILGDNSPKTKLERKKRPQISSAGARV